jgi:hypothetical protein
MRWQVKFFVFDAVAFCGGSVGAFYAWTHKGPEISPWPLITLAIAIMGARGLWDDFVVRRFWRKAPK